MESLFRYVAPPHTCSYLSDRSASQEYVLVGALTPAEYLILMNAGWRRFGHTLFRPQCPGCTACQSIRVPIATFQPNRSQRRCQKLNDGVIELRIGPPKVTRQKLKLYDRFHEFQTEAKGWPGHPSKDPGSYAESFVANPFDVEEWCYYFENRLVGVGYVDAVPQALSAIYYFWEPDLRERSLGTWNVLTILGQARRRRLPHVYLGYYVAGCRSLEYKATFRPNEVLRPDGSWHVFRE